MRHGFKVSVFGTHPQGAGKVNAAFAAFAETYALPDDVRRSLNVALDELLANALSHGMAGREGALLTVEAKLDQECVNITITDDGPPFDPLEQQAPDTTLSVEDRLMGGLGIHLVRELMDEVSYERRGDHNVVILVKRLG